MAYSPDNSAEDEPYEILEENNFRITNFMSLWETIRNKRYLFPTYPIFILEFSCSPKSQWKIYKLVTSHTHTQLLLLFLLWLSVLLLGLLLLWPEFIVFCQLNYKTRVGNMRHSSPPVCITPGPSLKNKQTNTPDLPDPQKGSPRSRARLGQCKSWRQPVGLQAAKPCHKITLQA